MRCGDQNLIQIQIQTVQRLRHLNWPATRDYHSVDNACLNKNVFSVRSKNVRVCYLLNCMGQAVPALGPACLGKNSVRQTSSELSVVHNGWVLADRRRILEGICGSSNEIRQIRWTIKLWLECVKLLYQRWGGHQCKVDKSSSGDEIPERDVTYHLLCLLIYHWTMTHLYDQNIFLSRPNDNCYMSNGRRFAKSAVRILLSSTFHVSSINYSLASSLPIHTRSSANTEGPPAHCQLEIV